ncbi:MAG TPA: cysteine rich repeat-containing protein [Nitrospira sp.]|nr:cysteine rich repeat-containing protein [Nitrospira sp.]
MSHQPVSNRILAGTLTFLCLALVWVAIVSNLPSQQELSAKESPQAVAQAVPTVVEPTLDLSIPGVPTMPQAPTTRQAAGMPPASTSTDLRAAQVARLRCDAEVEQLCPASSDGSARRQCLERRAQQLPVSCQQQVRERLIRWKEERNRLVVACQADIRRFCPDVRPGGGHQLQCLQQHAQELSDGCYELLPKGTLYFKQ